MLFFSQPGSASDPLRGDGPAVKPRRSYEQLRDAGLQAVEAGRLAEALELFERSRERAREREDEGLVDLAVCNRSAVLVPLGRQQEVMSPLRQILVRNRDARTCALAAYNLSRAHERNKEHKKGLFYGRIARDRAVAIDWLAAESPDPHWLVAESHNQIGNCLMNDSRFEQAAAEYRQALELSSEEPTVLRALFTVNLGYCLMMLGKIRAGARLSFQSLRWFRRFGARVYEAWPHLDLCYAYLELGRYRRAREHGRRALAIGEETGESSRIKTALFMLGETERSAGDLDAAWDHFSRLQQEFYPDSPQIVELMLAVGMRKVVNLRA